MAIGDNNEKYYAPTYSPTTYASDAYANDEYGNGGYWEGDYYNPDAPKASTETVTEPAQSNINPIQRTGGEHDPNPPSGKEQERSFDNNFGYGGLGILGDIASVAGKVIGGPVGFTLGMPNKLDDINTEGSVNAARKALGLETTQLGARNVGRAMLGRTTTKVGTVNIGDVTYDVDMDPKNWGKINPETGIATISPKEAKENAEENKTTITEVEAPETPSAPKGPLSKAVESVKDKVSSIAQSVFGNPEAQTKQTVKEAVETSPAAPSNPSVVGATPGYNPSAPSPANPTQNVGLNAQPSNPASVASSKPSANAGLAPGFGNLAGISRDQGWAGSKRPGPVDPGLESAVQDAVGRALGPGYSVSITSGMGEYGKANHRSTNAINGFGAAMDFHVTDDLTGKTVTAKDKLDKVALSLAESGTVTGIGYGKGYMGGVNFHADKVSRSTQKAWGQGESKKGMMKNDPELYDAIQAEFADTRAVTKNFADTMAGKTAPTIGTREAALQQAQAQQAMNAGLSPADQMSNMQAFGLNPSVNSPADLGAIARNAFDTQYGISTPTAVAENQALDSLSNVAAQNQALTANPNPTENQSLDSMSNVSAGVGSMTPGLGMTSVSDDPTANVGTPARDTGIQTIGDMAATDVAGLSGAPNMGFAGLSAMNAGYAPGTSLSPSNLSQVGMGYSFTDKDVSSISRALSGELSPAARAALTAGPTHPGYQTAVNETAAMTSSVQNRVADISNINKDNPVDQALDAYDSVNGRVANAVNNTNMAYAQDGLAVSNTVRGILDGTISATNPAQQANNYGTPSAVANAAWGNPNTPGLDSMQKAAAENFQDTATQVGSHVFGGYSLGVGAPQNTSGYGVAVGPAAATSVTGMSGVSHNPGSMYGGTNTAAGNIGGFAGANSNALGGGLGLGGGYVDGGISGTNTGQGSTSMGQSNSDVGGTSSSANGNTAGSGDSGSSSGNGNSSGSGEGGHGGSDGAGGTSDGGRGGSSGGLGGRGDNDGGKGDGRGR